MTFILFLSSAMVGFLSLTQFHTLQHRQELFLWLFHFELLQNLVKVCTHWKNLSSVLIYLYRSWCSICKQLHRGLSLKNSFQTLLYALQNNSTLFPINNMSFTYTYQKCCSAPTHFLVNTGFTASLYKTICFDQLIKAYIPTPRCLHQSINRSLELAYFVSTFRIDKTFWLHHIQLFFNKSIKECSFVYPFARFHKMRQLLTWFRQTLSIDTSEKLSHRSQHLELVENLLRQF